MSQNYTGARRFRSRFGAWQFAWAALLVLLTVFAFGAARAETVQLRTHLETSGPAVTLGDLFTDAGAVAGRAVAPAPRPGESTTFSARFLIAAAASAGLQWTPPAGMDQIVVASAGGDGRTRVASAIRTPATRGASVGEAVVRKGDTITLSFVAPGMLLTTRAKALSDAGVGDPVRLINLQSNKTVEAIVTGPGAASANRGQSF